ncbi:efflux RND transporter permease subunit [Neolewinella lacunae]|uniref:efflux RND transporter permease subunit n=1 Tax=Neolewinella lacunae TaxID=1517758 RepID=UPI0022285381|nr:efflux RND transporter permease subunit [Neolewinella lacunae]MDN3635181.1 efflux RND transporter permease subunit [Neolewinella lacunae]
MHRPVAVLLTTLTVIVLGLLAAARLPISLLPEVGIPRVSVQVSYPNAAARTVEDAVVAPLRNTLLQVNGLTDIQSRSRDEAAILYLDFPFSSPAYFFEKKSPLAPTCRLVRVLRARINRNG